jgi:SAM-dependent methyltransferase
MSLEPAGYTARNKDYWEGRSAFYEEAGRRAWADEPSWGEWRIPESEVRALPDVSGKDAVELGCGPAYWSAWLARMGARPVGVDIASAQLEKARELQREHGLEFPLLQASAESVPLPDASFDLALSEYGASTWCDPYRWIPEAARLLRPGGELVFLRSSTLVVLCSPVEDVPVGAALARDQFGLHSIEWANDGSIEFHLSHGDWIRVLRESGFEVVDLIELQVPDGAETPPGSYVSFDWARRWPHEEIWRARKRDSV